MPGCLALNAEAVEHPMEDEVVLIDVFAGNNQDGPVFEEIPAIQLKNHHYKLLKSPGLALNLAKNDVVSLPNTPTPAKVIERGGNFCIQIYSAPSAIDLDALDRLIREQLNGSLDGANQGNLAFSAPASNGLEKINAFFDNLKKIYGVDWYYSNIYKNFEDPSDEELLNWWV